MQGDLGSRRLAASEASGGISGDNIYAMALAKLRDNGRQATALDFGAGQGNFSQRLSQSGLYSSITAADLMPRSASVTNEIVWLQSDLNERLPLPDCSFDVIAAIEVIEHLENPRAMLRDCFRLLRPNGLLVLTTPNNESLRSLLALLLRGHYSAFGPESYPAHITPLLRIDLHRAAREAGFIDCAIEFSGHGKVPKMSYLQWQQLAFGYLRGCRFSDNLLFACRRPLD